MESGEKMGHEAGMNIAHGSTEDITGGAARAAYRLHTAMNQLGHDSLLFVANCRTKIRL